VKLLFICTHNRCRSIIAEAITNHFGEGRLLARSAGSHPSGEVHADTLRHLREAGIDTDGLCSQSWDEYEAWKPDVVITVCDQAAGEPCPLWFGSAIRAHWGLEDPSRKTGDAREIDAAYRFTIETLKHRVLALVEAQADHMEAGELAELLEMLGTR